MDKLKIKEITRGFTKKGVEYPNALEVKFVLNRRNKTHSTEPVIKKA